MQSTNTRNRITGLIVPLLMALITLGCATASWAVAPQISAGGSHTLTLRSDGTLWASGSNQFGQLGDGSGVGQPTPVQIGNGNWKTVSAGPDHSLAIKPDGTLWSWGSNTFGQLGLPKIGIPPNDSFAAGSLTPVQIGTDTNWVTVAAAGFSSFALKADGSLWVWGDNAAGQLGDGTLIARAEPFQLPAPLDGLGNPSNGFFTAVSSSGEHTLALQADGTLWAFGFNLFGQLGNGNLLDRLTPEKIGTDTNWSAIAAGETHSVALKANGTLWTWGRNDLGQLGNGAVIPGPSVTTPVMIVGTGTDDQWVSVSGGEFHTIALKRNGTVWAWGSNAIGQLGDGSITSRTVPTLLSAPAEITSNVVAISAGAIHSLALAANGQLYAWGDNAAGQFGNGSVTSSLSAVAVATDTINWIATEPGGQFTAALRSNGTLWTWGDNGFGQLGNNSIIGALTPVQVGTATNWRSVATGTNHTAAVKADGTLWTWGAHSAGQLGDGTATASVTAPQQILVSQLVNPLLADNDWSSVAAGTNHTLALKADGSIWVWGDNFSGQLGMFDPLLTANKNLPTRLIVSGAPGGFDNNWVAIAAGGTHTLALQANGTLWSWGRNVNGESGIDTLIGTSFFTPQPVLFTPVPAGASQSFNTGWTAIAAGINHSVGLQADGTLWAWGANNLNQLGNNNTNIGSFTPVRVDSPTAAYVSISAGDSHSLALQANGTLWAWGRNDVGQLGINSTVTPTTPQQVTTTSPASANNDWSAIGAGSLHSIVLKNHGLLWAMGNNNQGQLGINSIINQLVPTGQFEAGSVVSPTSLAFGPGYIGIVPAPTRTITITNTGTALLTATISGTNPAAFSISPTTCTDIAPAGSCIVTVTFTPLLPLGAKTDTLTIASNDPVSPVRQVTVTGTALNPFFIAASASGGGSITPSGSIAVAAGGSQAFLFPATPGFRLQDVVVDGISQGALGSYTFSNVQGPHTIVANFVATVTINVVAAAGPGGTISPNGSVTVNLGDNKTFFVTPEFGYKISDVTVTEMVEQFDINGVSLGYTPITTSLGPVNNYTFFDVRVPGNSITASFAATSIRTWNWRNPLPQGLATRHAETDGDGSYAAVGESGVIMTSANGLDWTVHQSGTMNLNGVAFGDGRFVAVGNSGRILRSSTKAADGYASWSEQSSGTASHLNGVIYNGTVFVAVGNSLISENFPFIPKMTILTSPDGITWTDHSPFLAINETLDLRDVAASTGSTLAAVGSGGTIFTSADNGVNWVRIADDLNGRGSNINSITFGGGTFVAAGDFAQITTSSDNGATWNPVNIPNSFADLKGIAYGTLPGLQNVFVAVGSDGEILTSENLGANWSNQISGIANLGSGPVLHTVVIGTVNSTVPQVLVAGEYGALLSSPDALTWTNELKSATGAALRGVARGNATFVAVGGDPATHNGPASASIVISRDSGLTWTPQTLPAGSQNLTAAAYGNGMFVAVGKSAYNSANLAAKATILSSPDGITWTSRTSGSFLGLNAVIFANNQFIAVGDYNPAGNAQPEGAAILTSPDGITWSFVQVITQNGTPLNSIAASGTSYVAVGELGSLLTSPDGTIWTDRGADLIINGYDLTGIAFGSNTFRAVGLTLEVGVGPTSFVSTDLGATWTAELLPGPTTLNLKFQGITYFNNQFIAVGNDNFILSKEAVGVTPWEINTGAEFINSSLYGIAAGNGSYVAVGSRGTILQTAQQVTGLPEISVTPQAVSFGAILTGLSSSRTVTVTNTGSGNLNLGTLSIPSAAYALNNDFCSTATLAPQEFCTVDVIFAPLTATLEESRLQIPSNDPDAQVISVSLAGSGIASATLTLTVTGAGSGSVSALPAGTPSLNCTNGVCTSIYPLGSVITLTATTIDWKAPGVFTGACTGIGTCSVTMSADRGITTTFDILNKVRITAGTVPDHPSIQLAYGAADSGAELKSETYLFPENLLFNQAKDVTLSGGWNDTYAAATGVDSYSVIQGKMTIRSGSVRVRNIRIK